MIQSEHPMTVRATAGRGESRMKNRATVLAFCLMLVCLLPAAWGTPAEAQSGEAPERRLDLGDVRAQRAAAESDLTLDEGLRNSIVEMYDAAIGSLQAAAAHSKRAAALERDHGGIDRRVASLQAELRRSMPPPRTGLPDGASADVAELTLARERARLAAHLSTLRDNERLVDERTASRSEVSRSLGALDQKIDALSDELRAAGDQAIDPQLKQATRTRLMAQREATVREIEALRAELTLLDARGSLIPLQIDRAQRRVERSEAIVARLQQASRTLRQEEAKQRLQSVRDECRDIATEIDLMAEIAAETERLAELLLGPDGVEVDSEQTAGRITAVRKHLSDLGRMKELTVRKFDAVGYAGSAYRWWPEIPDDFPPRGEVASKLRDIEHLIPSVQHDLIRFRQQRSRAREVREQAMLELRIQLTDEESQARLRRARELFDTRREVLDQLIRRYDRYSQQLIELNILGTQLLEKTDSFRSYILERVLWVRSVPRPNFPRPSTLFDSVGWLVSPQRWAGLLGIMGRAFWESRWVALLMAGIIVLLLVGRRPMRRRLARLAGKVDRHGSDSLWVSVEALLHTALLAAPLPLTFYFMSDLLGAVTVGAVPASADNGLYFLALTAGLLEMARQITGPDGLARCHFFWPPRSAERLHRVLGWGEAICLPLLFVTLHFSMTGFDISSSEELRSYNNALGRVTFVAALLILGTMILGQFRPRIKRMPDPGHDLAPSYRLYFYAYPLIAAATFLPALLAVIGYYITGYLLAYQMLMTLWLLLGLLVLGGLLSRWRRLNSQSTAGDPVMEGQVHQLTRFLVTVAAAVGLIVIWSGALPMIQLAKRVQLLPRIALLEVTEKGAPAPSASPGKSAAAAPADGGKKEEAAAKPAAPGMPPLPSGSAGDTAAATAESSILTLWKLLEAMIAAIVTWVLVKNLPGLIELILRRRTTLESGVRFALSTLVRYTIMIVGVSVTLGFLGVSWGKIQFLAAALTFGLAFGLQEIVANFISGLIILMEQPIRVGDAVTIGNLMGRVTRIQIRATTITLWDRSEMVVPNKDFITTQLINWTLSDSKRRITVPLRIKYGADLQRVKALLFGIAKQHPAVLDDPAPQVVLIEFGNDAVQFDFRTFVDFGEGEKTKDELQMTIDTVFRREGIELALPQLSIQLPAQGSGASSATPATPPADAPA
jgi:potassium efflux system protein